MADVKLTTFSKNLAVKISVLKLKIRPSGEIRRKAEPRCNT